MAQSSARCSPRQNPHDGKDELARGTPTNGSNRCIQVSAATRDATAAAVSVIALLATSGFADSSVVRYLEDELQRIFRTVLDSRHPASFLVSVIAPAPHSEGTRQRPSKAWFPDIYQDKTHLPAMRRSLCYRRCHRPKPSFVCGYPLKGYRPVLMAATLA